MISQMSIDRAGLARAAALLAAGLHTLDHQQPSGGQRPRQPDPIALGALDADRHPRPGRHLRDSGQQLREPAAVVADPQRATGLPARSAIST
jgi:hypothetical protein